jgi:methylmalonyl-CoA/ethylmalonyl-CoA epimerase
LALNLFERIDHVAIVVEDMDASLQLYCGLLGFALLERRAVPEQLVEAAFLDAGNGTLELIQPTDESSGTARFLQNRGAGMHHVCFEVADIEAALAELKEQGMALIDETPRRGVHGLVAFIHPKATSGVLIELLQRMPHRGH